MDYPLIASLEHPLIIALRHAGEAAQVVAQQLLWNRTVPGSDPEFAELVEALVLDQTGVGARDDRRISRTKGVEYRAKRREASARYEHRTQLCNALVSISVDDRRRILAALADGTGAALARRFQAEWYDLVVSLDTSGLREPDQWAIRLASPEKPRRSPGLK